MKTTRSVLIVEDENIVQLHLSLLVQDLGYAVSGVAGTAAEALRSARELAPDLVLMDVHLPGGRDGIEAARELRESCDPAMVFLTAFGDEEIVTRAQDVGANGFIVKPFNKTQLRASMSSALRDHERMQRVRESELSYPYPLEHAGNKSEGPRNFGAGTRLAIFSHDTLGLGHLQRTMNIAKALITRYPGLSILLLTGSPAVHRYTLPEGVDYIKLPAVRKVAPEEYDARSLGVSSRDVLKLRTNLILRSLQDYDPDVLLVDHAPLGMKGEMLPALEWLGKHRPGCVKLLGLRDVIDEPQAVIDLWNEQGTYASIQRLYEHVLVYGSPAVFETAKAYAFPEELCRRTTYCNYVSEARDEQQDAAVQLPPGGKPLVVVTIGGGDGGGELVIGNYLAMLQEQRESLDFESLVLTGPFLPQELRLRFEAQARGLPVRLVDFVESTRPYLERADLVVSTCGYNTMAQNLAYSKRGLVIPRVMHRQEQWIRASRLQELGLIRCLRPEEVTPARLFQELRSMLADPACPLARARAAQSVPLDGTERVAQFCGKLRFA